MLHKKIKASIQSDTGIFRLFRDQTELNFSQLEVVYIFGQYCLHMKAEVEVVLVPRRDNLGFYIRVPLLPCQRHVTGDCKESN